MSVLAAASSPVLVAAVISSVASLVSTALLVWVAFRAQSAKDQLNAIEDIAREHARELTTEIKAEIHAQLDAPTRGLVIADIVRRSLREVLRTELRRRHESNDE